MSGGALESSVTLEEVFAVVGAKRVPLAPELAGYLVLEIAEHADPNGGDVDPKSVFVGEEGTVALVKPRREVATGDAEASIRAALARLLGASGSQTPALAAASKRASGAGLSALAEELEAALIPVNRAAGRRALARLAREVKRVTLGVGRAALPSTSDGVPGSRRGSSPSHHAVGETPAPPRAGSGNFSADEPTTARAQVPEEVLKKATPPPTSVSELPTMQFEPAARAPSKSQADIDSLIAQFGVSGGGEQQHARELKAMVGLDPTPPPPPELARRLETREVPVGGGDADVESLLAMGADAPQPPQSSAAQPPLPVLAPPPRPSAASLPDARVEARRSRRGAERQLPTGPSQLKKARGSMSGSSRARTRGTGLIALLAVALLGAGAFAVWELRPGAGAERATRRAGPATSAPAAAARICRGLLVVTDVPPHAEVLLRKGQAPVDVERMPVGTRLEFVATAEGYAPKRVVVPAGATWDSGPDGKPRYEAAVQLDRSRARPGANDPWPAGEPGSEVGGQGPPGTVHVVATPRGAEIWMLAGIGPEARIELHCDEDQDVLVAGPTTYRKRLHVAASAFVADDAMSAPGKPPTRVARISAK